MVSVASFLLFFLYGTVSQSTSKVPGQILIHAFLPDRVLGLMAFLTLHVAFTGFTMSCDSGVRAGPCLVPWPLEPRNCAAIYWRLGTRKRTNADHLYRFFLDILHSPFEISVLCSLFFFYFFFFLFIETLIPPLVLPFLFFLCPFPPKWPLSRGPIWMETILLRILVTARTPRCVVNFLNPFVPNLLPPKSLSPRSPCLDGSSVTGVGSF